MTQETQHREEDLLHEQRHSLYLLTTSPAIWAAHFLGSYIAAALWCRTGIERTNPSMLPLHSIVIGLALVALVGIGLTAQKGWRMHTYGESEPPHADDTPEDRHRFMGFATLLLSALSAVAVVYVAGSVLFFRSCY